MLHSLAISFMAAAAPAGAGGDGGHQPGLIDFDPTTAVWVLVIFVVLLAILYPTAWKQVLAALKAREQRIRNDIAQAEAQRLQAEATLRQYTAQLATAEEKTRQMLAAASAEAERIAATIKTQAQQDAEEIKERAHRDIDEARQRAVAEFYAQAADLATSVAEKILRRNLNADDQRELVRRSLQEMQTLRA